MLQTGEQLRHARTLLALDLGSVARASDVPVSLVEQIEKSGVNIIDAPFQSVLAVQQALTKLGIEFFDSPSLGARLREARLQPEPFTVEADIHKRILVADDDPLSRDILSRRLSRLGFVVTVADTGSAALSLLATARFHAVLLDSMMPDLPGLDVLQRLRRAKNHTRVIMVTGKALASDIDEAMALGADGYMTKPVDLSKLVTLIEGE